LGANQQRDPVEGLDGTKKGGCKVHDQWYADHKDNASRLKGDKALFKYFFTRDAWTGFHLVDFAFGGRPSVGSTYKFTAILGFGGIIIPGRTIIKKLK
jgi:hypothetical protein